MSYLKNYIYNDETKIMEIRYKLRAPTKIQRHHTVRLFSYTQSFYFS